MFVRKGLHTARIAAMVANLLGIAIAACGAPVTKTPTSDGWTRLKYDSRLVDMPHMKQMALTYFPILVKATDVRPEGITKEPAYRAKPKYATLHLGSGPSSTYIVAFDEPEGQPAKVYVDVNRNGDLTDDGDGAWKEKTTRDGIDSYGPNVYDLRASYGTPQKETSFSPYAIALYRTPARSQTITYRCSGYVGRVVAGGKPYYATLFENDSDAIFAKRYDQVPTLVDGKFVTHPVRLLLDPIERGLPEGNPGRRHIIDIRGTFVLNDMNYVADVSPDGTRIRLRPTPVIVAAPPLPDNRSHLGLLPAGKPAPDFGADGVGGVKLKLSDYRGKVVIVDFWATWCGPCQASMPGLQKIYNQIKDQGVVVLSLNVFDERDAFNSWIATNFGKKYNFTFGYDPAGRDQQASVASSKYGVSGIPTMYVIGRDGLIADSIVGSGNEKHLVTALGKLGVKAIDD